MIDTHTHYFLKEFDCDRWDLLERLRENGITHIVEAAIDMESNFIMRKYFADNDMVSFGSGIHPLRVKSENRIYGLNGCENILRTLIKTPKTVAIGETGLDYTREVSCEEDKELQKTYFRMQLELALETDMPLILHVRGCHEDALEILESYGKQFKGVCHCFIGSACIAQRYTDLGFSLGIGGSCTYSKNREGYEEFIRDLPVLPPEKMVLETDSPYLIPVGCKGKRNNSLNLSAVLGTLSRVMDIPEEMLESIIERNAKKCFSLE